jgi:hypothetical protein
MTEFLDVDLCEKLRKKINETNIFLDDQEYHKHYNLICAVMDRLDSCVEYLNSNSDKPKTEEKFIVFVMYACMVLDAIKQIFKDIKIEYHFEDTEKEENYIFFKTVCKEYPMNLSEKDVPTDERFFEYLRAIIFAHPFMTSRPKFLKEKEIQYSPWVIVNSHSSIIKGKKEDVGVRIYSSVDDDVKDLKFSFILLKEFIQSRYKLFEEIIYWVQEVIDTKNIEWKERKVNRELERIEILEDIVDILSMRYEDNTYVEAAITFLSCEITNPKNAENVNLFRDNIIRIMPALCDAIDEMDYEKLDNLLRSILSVRPKNMHEKAYYQLEKIFSYLNKHSGMDNIEWGIEQAKVFFEEFAYKWVDIDVETMKFDEIKLLVTVACYLEYKEEQG